MKPNDQDVALAVAELTRRANDKRDGRAAFLLGREYQYPANPQMKLDPETAAKWFKYGSDLGDPSAVEAFSMCLRKGYGGLPVNIAQADILAKWAVDHGYVAKQDHQSIDYSAALSDQRAKKEQEARNSDDTKVIVGIAILAGLAALLANSGDSKKASDSTSGNTSTDQSSAYTNANGSLKYCTLHRLVYVPDPPGSAFAGHEENQAYQGSGAECP
jgi:hypothetical protein